MKLPHVKYKIIILACLVVLGLLALHILFVEKTSAETAKINAVKAIMMNESDTESPIIYQGIISDIDVSYTGSYALSDDRYDYVFNPNGYLVMAQLKEDETSIDDSISENQESMKDRALGLHRRNLVKWLAHEQVITEKLNPMGTTTITITETRNGKPIGIISYIIFTRSAALISYVSVNNLVSEAELAKADAMSQDQAAAIAFSDLIKNYGKVLEQTDLAQVHWTSARDVYDHHSVWAIVFTKLTRTDFDEMISDWGATYKIDIQTGEILIVFYQS